MRILQLVSNRWWTGTADPVLSLSRGLQQAGFQVYFGCTRGDTLEKRAQQAGLSPLPWLSLDPKKPHTFAQDLLALRRFVQAEQIDIIHTHLSHDHWLAGLVKRSCPDPSFLLFRTLHTARGLHNDPLHRWLFSHQTDHFFTVSRALQEECCRVGGIAATRISVVPGGVDTQRFHPDVDGRSIREEFHLAETAPVIGIVARLAPSRGHLTLLAALQHVVRRYPQVKLLIVGKGEYRPVLERHVRAQGLEKQVIFTGYREDDLPAVLAAMDVFVLLHGGSEGSCRALLEAMAMGKACVAGAEGALQENVEDRRSGLVVDPEDPREIAEAILCLLQDRQRAAQMGREARRRVERCFTEKHRVERTVEVYQARKDQAQRHTGTQA
ncbi:MAG: glycosyltransferase family 1 protein [Nitrospinota bacterium]|nr:MAG: glycosyltransferase family 1 protein [Nitrospinota bacterium]